MLLSRSSPECRLYIALHPCSCGDSTVPPHRMRMAEGELVAEYAGACPSCGKGRRFQFALHAEMPPPPPAFGGDMPSGIVCPGQFLAHADALAAAVPAAATGVEPGARARAAARLAEAIAAIDEVTKHLLGADELAADGVWSEAGRRMYAQEPGRFRRARLEAVRAAYAAARDALAAAEAAR